MSRASATDAAKAGETAGASSAALSTNGRGEEAASRSARRQKANTAQRPLGGDARGHSPRERGVEQKRSTCVRAGKWDNTSARGGRAGPSRASADPGGPPAVEAEETQTLGPSWAERRAERAEGRLSNRRAPKDDGRRKEEEEERGGGNTEYSNPPRAGANVDDEMG